MNRREVLAAAGAAVVTGAAAPAPFDHAVVLRKARDLSRASFQSPDTPLPPALEALDYDGYRQIRFLETNALWADLDTPFRAHFFHRGGMARNRVELFEVADGRAAPILYSPAMYSFGKSVPEGLDAASDLGFAGFRLLNPLNRADKFDEIAAFIGASYFRGVAKGGAYGLSARGLAVRAGDWPEEFPVFRAWWLERPGKGAASVLLHGLLDSENVTGAFRFVVTPGESTTMKVSTTIFPRKNLERVGFAPLTSMFLFDQETARNYDDFRPAVHDSDGLAVAGIEGNRIWRPLANPARNRISTYPGAGGFGLIQRKTAFADYQDLEARYDLRPSLWVEPVRPFPKGTARLVELTAKTEYEDNIVAEWRADGALPAHVPVSVSYRLHWGPDHTDKRVARAHAWRVGAGDTAGWKRLVIDFDAPAGDPEGLEATVDVPGGEVKHVVVQPNTVTGGVRLAFNFKPGSGDIRCQLVRAGAGVSELWVYPFS